MKRILSALLPCLFLILFTIHCSLITASAQADTATLSGTVQDQNGAAIPAVTVTVENVGTRIKRTVTTNDSGLFTVPVLPAGQYTVSVEHQGFTSVTVNDLTLNVGDRKAIQIQMQVGAPNAPTVNVSADDVVEVRTDGSVGTVVTRQQIANMPLNGRTIQSLLQLVPGVVLVSNPTGGGATAGPQFSINGQRTTSNYFIVDGVSANTGIASNGRTSSPGMSASGTAAGTTALGGTNSLASLDAVQEFSIQTSTFAPEFGRTPGGQISLVTRGGTNEFRGSISEYFRNEALDANDWFNNKLGLKRAVDRQTFFGGVFGGPIKKNRLFFFASYEGLRLTQPSSSTVRVPTVAVRTSPNTSQFLRPYLNALPIPNGQDLPNGTAPFTASYSNTADFDIFSLRIDGKVRKNLTGFLRYNHAPSSSDTRILALSTVQHLDVKQDSYTGGITWTGASSVTTDIRVNWTRNNPKSFASLDSFGGSQVPNVSDIFAPGRDPSRNQFLFSAIGLGFNWGIGSSDVQRQLNIVGTTSWLVASHLLKFGVDYRRGAPLVGAAGGAEETFRFFTRAQLQSGFAPQYQIRSLDPVPRRPVFTNLSVFVQDTWHANKKLTLTYGVRLEHVPPPGASDGRLARTLLGIDTPTPQNLRLAPVGTPLWKSRFGDVAPRFGASYQLGSKAGWESVIRGGVGVFYDLDFGEAASQFATAYPFQSCACFANVAVPLSPSIRVDPNPATDPNTFIVTDPNLRAPYTIQWNGSLQQSLGARQSITVSYVGAVGRRLIMGQSFVNQTIADFPNNPDSVTLIIQKDLGRSQYNALQIQFQRRLRHGIEAIASYSLAKSSDNVSYDGGLVAPTYNSGAAGDVFAKNWGPSDFDIRHQLSSAVTIELPSGWVPKAIRPIFHNWSLDMLLRVQSGQPVDLNGGFFFDGGEFFVLRPDRVSGQPLYIFDKSLPGGRRFNENAFTSPSVLNGVQQQGNFPRNGMRGLPASQVDLALRRDFRFSERFSLQLKAEFFNVLNHPTFGSLDNDITDGTDFGQPSSMLNRSLGNGLSSLYQMGGPRSGELAIKFMF
jgi:hypothetical protein